MFGLGAVFVRQMFMTNEKPVRFTLSDNTEVVVKKATNDKYDFELKLPNGNRKTFLWSDGDDDLKNKTGDIDEVAQEALRLFAELCK